jgi:hypothetical protein
LYDFFEIRSFFLGTDSREDFCILIVRGSAMEMAAKFVFSIKKISEIDAVEKKIEISPEDFKLLNPNTQNCPIFRTKTDAELTKTIYRRFPIILNESLGSNPWKVTFRQGLFNMTSDSGLFFSEFNKGRVPLYEGKMFYQYDHRHSSYNSSVDDNLNLNEISDDQKKDPSFFVKPRYWVDAQEVKNQFQDWNFEWFIAFRDVTNSTSERTSIFSILPRVGVGNNAPLIFPQIRQILLATCLTANLCSLTFDFVARHKVGGNHMNFFIIKQLPILPPDCYSHADIDFIAPRVLELTYTAWDLQPFAQDMGYDGEPFIWNPDRRALLRAELDAYYAHLYGLTRDELRYILDPADLYGPDFPSETFRVLKNNEMKQFGEYRTQRLVLEAWDKLGF